MRRAILIAAVCGAFCLTSCAPERRKARVRVVVPRSCLEKIELTEKTVCDGPDAQHLTCRNLILSKKKGCEQLSVEPAK